MSQDLSFFKLSIHQIMVTKCIPVSKKILSSTTVNLKPADSNHLWRIFDSENRRMAAEKLA